MTIDELIAWLTVEHAIEYASQTDKWVWVVVNLLDPNNLSSENSDRVEDALDKMIKELESV